VLRRLPTLLLVALLAVVAAACGNRTSDPITEGETEGIYVQVAGLKYQVQTSRQLNPLTSDDQSYLQGLAPEDARLRPDEEWFAIFMRVESDDPENPPLPSAVDFEIRDTQENVYTPVEFVQARDRNTFVYQSRIVAPGDTQPLPDTPAGERPPYGELILFKVRRFSLDNRPLELIVKSRQVPQTEGTVNLDV
jgi:hypothetical protein